MALELGKKANDSRRAAWLGVRVGSRILASARSNKWVFFSVYLSEDPLTISAASSLTNMISYSYSGNTLMPRIEVSVPGTARASRGRRPVPHGAHHQLKESRQGSFIISIVETGN